MDTLAVLREFFPVLLAVQVEPYEGQTASGPKYGAAVTEQAVIDRKRRHVAGEHGATVLSEAMLIARIDANFPDGSRVTLPDGAKTYVITVATFDDHGQEALPAHLEVFCQ